MKRNILILLLTAGIFLACTDKNKLPEGVLPHDKMKAVMWDMIRAGDFLNNYVFFKEAGVNKSAQSEKWNEKIFQMHKITRAQFEKSYAYYQQHPPLMKAVMDSISKIKVEEVVAKPAADTAVKADTVKKKADSAAVRLRLNRLKKLNLPHQPAK